MAVRELERYTLGTTIWVNRTWGGLHTGIHFIAVVHHVTFEVSLPDFRWRTVTSIIYR